MQNANPNACRSVCTEPAAHCYQGSESDTFQMREVVRRQPESDRHADWFRHEVQAGLDSAKVGHLVDADVVGGRFAADRTRTRHRMENLR